MTHASPMPAGSVQDLKVDIQHRGPAVVVRLVGSANMDVATPLRDQLLGLISEDTRQIVLDLADLEFINSVGLGAIIAGHLRCRRYNGVVKIVAPRPAVYEVLSITKLTHIFPVYPSIEAAMASV